jgi:ribonuclease HI
MERMKHLHIYSDGSGTTKGKPGGWAYLIVDPEERSIIRAGSGNETETTSNRMELTAAIMGLRAIRQLISERTESIQLTLKSDSMYVLGIASGEYQARANLDLVSDLCLAVDALPQLKTQHVKGHKGEPFNEMADRVASIQRNKVLSEQENQ